MVITGLFSLCPLCPYVTPHLPPPLVRPTGGQGCAGAARRPGAETLPGQHPHLLAVLLTAAGVRQHGACRGLRLVVEGWIVLGRHAGWEQGKVGRG